jgi:exonuclease III
MKIVSWNLNARTKLSTLKGQCDFLKSGSFDLITLQEVTINSQDFIKEHFKDQYVISSFDLANDLDILKGRRKYGEIIISKFKFIPLDPLRISIPFRERVLSIKLLEGYKDLEICTTHIPPGSSNGVIKVEHFEGLSSYLRSSSSKMILTGDFNSPRSELKTGQVVTWGQRISKNGTVKLALNPKWKSVCTPGRWDFAERSIIENHYQFGLKDAFRDSNSYDVDAYSWYVVRKDKQYGRRYDHIFCSKSLGVVKCYYEQEPRRIGLSDHSPVIADLLWL